MELDYYKGKSIDRLLYLLKGDYYKILIPEFVFHIYLNIF